MKEPHGYMTKKEFADYMSMSPRTIDNWVRKKILPHAKLGKSLRIPVEEAKRHIAENYTINARGAGRTAR